MSPPSWVAAGQRLGGQPVRLDELLTLIVDGVARQLRAERATLFLLDRAKGELVSRAGHLDDIAEIRLAAGEGVAGYVARTGKPTIANRDDPRFSRRVDDVSGFRTESLAAAPLQVGGQTIGVLEALNRDGGFGAAEKASLAEAAGHVAALIGGTSLFTEQRGKRTLTFRFNGVVGESDVMAAVYDRAVRAARSEASVLVRGESGTGKELIARAVHANSPRREGAWVKVDCAALPGDLVENELFGHERGAYTGADRGADGKVAAAEGGTLFLDEIGELPLPAQGKLLRLVQDRAYYRVGGTSLRSADVRLVAATHRDLAAEVAAGRFRQDLYYRLRVVELRLPPLRERGPADLDRLVDHLFFGACERHGRELALGTSARASLHRRSWPGNVRELEHALEAAVVLADGPTVQPGDLPGVEGVTGESGLERVEPLRIHEKRYIEHVLEACDGNRSEAARRLEIGRNTLLRKLQG